MAFLPAIGWLQSKVPIYTDEVSYKMIQARSFLDGFISRSLTPQCTRAEFDLPWIMWPQRAFESLLYQNLSEPARLRWYGIAIFLALIAVLVYFARSLFNVTRTQAAFFVLCLICLGVSPLAFALNRPEVPIALVQLLALALALRGERSGGASYRYTFGIIVLALYSFSIHPKTLLFLPVFLCASFLAVRFWLARAVSGIAVLSIAALTYRFYALQTGCPGDASVAKFLNGLMLSPQILKEDPLEFLKIGIGNLGRTFQYAQWLLYDHQYMSDWLPRVGELSKSAKVGNTVLKLSLTLQSLIILSGIVLGTLKSLREKHLKSNFVILLAVGLGLFSFSFFQSSKNAYESVMVLPLFCSLTILSLSQWPQRVLKFLTPTLIGCFFLVFLVGQIVLIHRFLPIANSVWAVTGPLEGQRYSFSTRNYQTEVEVIKRLETSCRIDSTSEYVVVDDVTYPVFWRSPKPYHAIYLSPPWTDAIQDLRSFFHEIGVKGWISDCRAVPPNFRDQALSENGLCCLPDF